MSISCIEISEIVTDCQLPVFVECTHSTFPGVLLVKGLPVNGSFPISLIFEVIVPKFTGLHTINHSKSQIIQIISANYLFKFWQNCMQIR